jgi:hypothetical protein
MSNNPVVSALQQKRAELLVQRDDIQLRMKSDRASLAEIEKQLGSIRDAIYGAQVAAQNAEAVAQAEAEAKAKAEKAEAEAVALAAAQLAQTAEAT